jgi:hypothetical protein
MHELVAQPFENANLKIVTPNFQAIIAGPLFRAVEQL